jgi:hypothetical protein
MESAFVSGVPDVLAVVEVEAVDADALPPSTTLQAGIASVCGAALLAGDDTEPGSRDGGASAFRRLGELALRVGLSG